jgi:hypothetical protein
MENELFKFQKGKFDEQVKSAYLPDDMTLEDVYDFIVGIYNYSIPERTPEEAEISSAPFGLLDYYNMESLGAFLKKQQAQLAALREALQKIANGNPGRPNWLTDIEMAEIARAALVKLEGAK